MEYLTINSKNIIGWLRLLISLGISPKEDVVAIKNYLARTDTARRQKELEDVFGGEEW